MKAILYTSLFLLLLLLGGCSKATSEDIDFPTLHEGTNAYLSVTINLPTFDLYGATRGVGDAHNDDVYQGTIDEQKVTSARLVMYELATNTVKYAFDLTASDVTTGNFTYPKFTVKARQLKKEHFDVLVLLNPTEQVKAMTAVGKTKADFEAPAEESVSNLASSTRGIYMANYLGYVRTTDANWRLSEAQAESEFVSLKVSVERSVAKVFVGNEQGTTIPTANGVATMNSFSLDVVNKKLFWMRKPNLALNSHGTLTTDAPTVVEDRTTPQKYKYAIDPNMEAPNGPGALPTSDFLYDALNMMSPRSMGGYEDSKGIYVTENTMNPTEQRGTATTRILFNIVYIPTALVGKVGADKSWANYKGKYLTKAELQQKLIDARTMTDDEMAMPHGFKVLATTLEGKDYTRSFDEDGLKYYHNGENIYASYIRHFDDRKQPKLMAYGRYGVLRNHVYKVRVNRVEGPGNPTPNTPPDEPDDKTKTYINISVTVAPWTVKHQGTIILD